jgi:hypothetical protein
MWEQGKENETLGWETDREGDEVGSRSEVGKSARQICCHKKSHGFEPRRMSQTKVEIELETKTEPIIQQHQPCCFVHFRHL